MNLVVCVKHVPDTESKIRVKGDGTGIVTEGLTSSSTLTTTSRWRRP